MLLLILVGLVSAAYVLYMCWYFRHFTKQGIVMSSTPIPILGTLLPVFTKGFVEMDTGNLERCGKTYGSFSGRNPVLTTVDPDILKEVFLKDFTSFPNRISFPTGDPLDDQMLQNITDYVHWKAVRSMMSPAFSTGKLRAMMKQMNKCAETYAGHLVREAKEGGSDKSLEMKEFAGSFSMDVIASTAFGIDVNTHEDRSNPFVVHAHKAFVLNLKHPLILTAFFAPFLQPIVRLVYKHGFVDRDTKKFFTDIVNRMLDERKERNERGGDGDQRVDFLQLLLNAHEEDGEATESTEKDGGVPKQPSKKRPMTRQELVSQAVLFFIAGYDTTARTIAGLTYNLACNPDAQDKLIDEVLQAVGDKEIVTDHDLASMPYLEMCVSESLRLFPVLIRLDRKAAKDMYVKGIYVPKDSLVGAPVFHMHRLAEIYPDPEAFIPERFSPEEKAKRESIHYMPFGAGPRMCIANRLALLEVKIAILHVLKTHRFVRAPDTQVPLIFDKQPGLLVPEKGIWLRLQEHGRNNK